MKSCKAKVLSLVITLLMATAMFAVTPATAHAATGSVAIDIGALKMLGTDADNSADVATDSQWVYDDSTMSLCLTTSGGSYTLTGTYFELGTDLRNSVRISNANVTLNNVQTGKLHLLSDACTLTLSGTNLLNAFLLFEGDTTVTGNGSLTLATMNYAELNNAHLTLTGSTRLTCNGSPGINSVGSSTVTVGAGASLSASGTGSYGFIGSGNTTIICDGTATLTGASGYQGLFFSGADVLTLDGTGTVTTVGSPAISSSQPIKMGNHIKLVITNNSASVETHTFTKLNPASSYRWKLTTATTTDALTDTSITVTLAAGQTGIIELESSGSSAGVCEVVETGVQYLTLDAGFAAVDDNQTVRLLENVALADTLRIDNGKAFTLNTNSFTLDFDSNWLRVFSGSSVDFVGCTDFANLSRVVVSGIGSRAGFDGDLVLKGLSSVLEVADGAEVTVGGDLIGLSRYGIWAYGGATVTVVGDAASASDTLDARDVGTKVSVGGSVTSLGSYGVYAHRGATVNVGGSVEANTLGVLAEDAGSKVSVGGNVTSSGDIGVEASGGAVLSIGGSIDAKLDGVHAEHSGTKVSVGGNVTSSDGYGVFAYSGATVSVDGDIDSNAEGVFSEDVGTKVSVGGSVSSDWIGIRAGFGATVDIEGNIDENYVGVYAYRGATVTIAGGVKVEEDGVYAEDSGTTVSIGGNITDTGTKGFGVKASSGATVSVCGNIEVSMTGVSAVGTDTTVNVGGNAIGGDGVRCYNGAIVTIGGDVRATDSAWGIAVFCGGVYVNSPAVRTQVFIKGNVYSTKHGVIARNNGQITIDGTITAAQAIDVNDLAVAKNPTTLKAGYDQYSDTPNGALPTITAVWVKNPSPTPTPQIPKTGDSAPLALTTAFILMNLGACTMVTSRRRRVRSPIL